MNRLLLFTVVVGAVVAMSVLPGSDVNHVVSRRRRSRDESLIDARISEILCLFIMQINVHIYLYIFIYIYIYIYIYYLYYIQIRKKSIYLIYLIYIYISDIVIFCKYTMITYIKYIAS